MIDIVRESVESTIRKTGAIRVIQEGIAERARSTTVGGHNARFIAVPVEQPYCRINSVAQQLRSVAPDSVDVATCVGQCWAPGRRQGGPRCMEASHTPAHQCATTARVATEADVAAIAEALPEVAVRPWHRSPGWAVAGRSFLRVRSEAEGWLVAFVDSVEASQALIAAAPDVFKTTPHYDGYPVVLVDLDAASREELVEIIIDSWLAKAPKRLAREHRPRLIAQVRRADPGPEGARTM